MRVLCGIQNTFRHADIQFHCVGIADLGSDPLARFEVVKPGRFQHSQTRLPLKSDKGRPCLEHPFCWRAAYMTHTHSNGPSKSHLPRSDNIIRIFIVPLRAVIARLFHCPFMCWAKNAEVKQGFVIASSSSRLQMLLRENQSLAWRLGYMQPLKLLGPTPNHPKISTSLTRMGLC